MIKEIKRVLIIDDDQGILEAISAILELEGYTVDATDKSQYLDKIPKDKIPDIILLDLLLSGKDGTVLVEQIKGKKGMKKIPIIMLSAHPQAKEAAERVGVTDFIAKPFDMEELLSMIDKHIKKP